jgi:hypothetical protein
MSRDAALDTLLELDGIEYHEENGFWYKFEISLVEPSLAVPHGIRYNLTLHDPKNQRILGFDNAHSPKVKKGKGSGRFKGRIVEYDHAHYGEKDQGTPYKFKDAEKLLKDFFAEMDKRIP